ncbi:hypothetical protein JI75_05235 [Berryella intestinalis]|uniref:Class I SAM-dependent methyltransferase n=1 Tax=Berryella intestinalis TaxID=1531429 RepID=A0A0A8BAJ6_9ACTN|nr:hypothetical protein [Berryella intestinalis]AJC12157.1 hypothetical protein JI75_05235 [Berryella intestinalis]
MDTPVANILCSLNTRFYRDNACSFSATRQAPWEGWGRCVDIVRSEGVFDGPRASVFDLACGNLRFEAYLQSSVEGVAFDFFAVDNCDALAADGARAVRYQSADVCSLLLAGGNPADGLFAPPCSIAVSFGFLHHVPTEAARAAALRLLADKTEAAGCLCVSLWRFMDDPRLARKARASTAQGIKRLGISEGDLEPGDHLLGWQDTGALRFCHSFSDAEVERLVSAVADVAAPVGRFRADGRGGNLNEYLVFKKKG